MTDYQNLLLRAVDMEIDGERQRMLEALLRSEDKDLTQAITYTGEANKKCQGAGYVVAGYFRLVNTEPDARLGARFVTYEKEVNSILERARRTANYYLYGDVNVMSLQRQILSLNGTIISTCEFQLANLQVLTQWGPNINTDVAVEIIDELILDGERGKEEAYRVERELSRIEQEVMMQGVDMSRVAASIGTSSGILSEELERLRYELKGYDSQIEMYENRLAEQETEIVAAGKMMATAMVFRRVITGIIRGIAFIREMRASNETRDTLAYLHERRGYVFERLMTKEEAMAKVEGYDQNLESIANRARHAEHELRNMGNAWGAQGDALRRIKELTVSENAAGIVILIALTYAEKAIRDVLSVAQNIRQQMASIAFVEERDRTVAEVYRTATTTVPRKEWEYPDGGVDVIIQSLKKKYGNRVRRAG